MNPSKAVELLEVIKIFLDIQGCVFVLAVDYGVVSRGVQEKYGKDMDEIKGRSFFDKIIQLPFNLPVANYTIGAYLESLFHISKEDINSYKKLAASSVGTNPRTLKRMANIMSLLEIVAKYEDEPKDITSHFRLLLFAALCMQMAFETVYAQILMEGARRNLLEVKNEELLTIFSDALERAPGKKDELQKKLIRFFNNLNEVLSNLDEDSWEQFSEVLNKSGIAASGSQQPLMASDAVKETFDPFLVANFAQLPALINEKYKSYFDLLQLKSKIDDYDPAIFSVPSIFAWAIDFSCTIGEEGIDLAFWTEERVHVKNAFKILLKKSEAKLPATPIANKGKSFLTLPTIPWKTSLSQKGRPASLQRYDQVKEVMEEWCSALLPALRDVYVPKAEVLAKINNLVNQIEMQFKKYLSEEKGWIYDRGDIGSSLFIDWSIMAIRKAGWNKDVKIELRAEKLWSNNLYIGLAMPKNDGYTEDKNIMSFYNIWKKYMKDIPQIDVNSIGQNEWFSAWVYLPADLYDWTTHNFDHDEFSFALNNSQEEQVVEFCKKCAESFAACEKQMDAIAICDIAPSR